MANAQDPRLPALLVIERFNEAFALKEAGRLEAALNVCREAEEASQAITYPDRALETVVHMTGANVRGTIYRQLHRFEDGLRAIDNGLAIASGFFAGEGKVHLVSPWYEPPIGLIWRIDKQTALPVIHKLTNLYYNKSQICGELQRRDEWERYLLYTLHICLQITANPASADSEIRAWIEQIFDLGAHKRERWFFLRTFTGYLARNLVQSIPAIADLAETPEFQWALQALQTALDLKLIDNEDWSMGMIAGFTALNGELSSLLASIQGATGNTPKGFSMTLQEDLNDETIAYTTLRLLLTAASESRQNYTRLSADLLNLAHYAYQMGMRAEVLRLMEAMTADQISILLPADQLSRTALLANVYSDVGRSTEAQEIYQETWEHFTRKGLDEEAALMMANMSDDALLAGNPQQAYDLALRGINGLSPEKQGRVRGYLLLNLGAAAATLRKMDEAEKRLREAVRVGHAEQTPERYLHRALYNLSLVLAPNHNAEADTLLAEALSLSQKLSHFRDQAQYYFEQARKLDITAHTSEAALKYRAALDVARRANDPQLEMLIIAGLAGIYQENYDDENAVTYFHKALNQARESGEWRDEAWILGNLATIYSGLRRFNEADQAWDRQTELARANNNQKMLLEILNARAISAYRRMDFPTALRFADEALELAEESENHRAAAGALMIMGNMAHVHNSFDQAVTLHLAALAEAEQSGDPRIIQKTHGFLGYSAGRLGEQALAVQHLQIAMDSAWDQGRPASVTSWAFLLGRLMEEKFDDSYAAFDAYRRAIHSLELVREDRELTDELDEPIGTLLDPQEVYRRAVRLALQLELPADAFSVIEQSRSRQLLRLLSQSQFGEEAMKQPFAIKLHPISWRESNAVQPVPMQEEPPMHEILQAELSRTRQREWREFYRRAGASPSVQLRLAQPVDFGELRSLIVWGQT